MGPVRDKFMQITGSGIGKKKKPQNEDEEMKDET